MIHELSPSLKHWPFLSGMTATRIEGGLINNTWSVGQPPVAVVQQLSPIFSPRVHTDIETITAHLAAKGLLTPRLLRTAEEKLFHTDSDGVTWRCMNWLPGVSHHRMMDVEMAENAGALVAEWHRAVDDLEHEFVFVRPEAHDTALHMQFVEGALLAHPEHRLVADVKPVAETILKAWAGWDGDLSGEARICHGDLKVSNIRFSATGEALCLLDLDTLSCLPLEVELGDAFRSWCNSSDENSTDVAFDANLFEAGMRGYQRFQPLSLEMRERIVRGVERICLELAARFAADALNEAYFGWDPAVAPGQGEHNLLRARGQLALAQEVRGMRRDLEARLGLR